MFWLDVYHADGLRVDAVASMLYRDYSRKEGEWIPNQFGGRENLEAISFIKQVNEATHEEFPDVYNCRRINSLANGFRAHLCRRDSGFDMKWMMGWMHDTLNYFSKDPVYRHFIRMILLSALFMPLPKNMHCPFRMMRWFTARIDDRKNARRSMAEFFQSQTAL
jgi:1,4-alpha-glucan branching enzyme